MLSEDIQNKNKRVQREKTKRKQKRDTYTKLKTHLNVTPKTNEKKEIRKKASKREQKITREIFVYKEKN